MEKQTQSGRGWTLWLALGIVSLCLVTVVHSQPSRGNVQKLMPADNCEGAAAALDVTSERMTFDQKTHTFVFEEKVRIRRCTMTIVCDRLQVTTDAKSQTIARLVALGNVHYQQGERHVVAERAEYIEREQKLVLTGNPRAWDTQELREMTGEQIVLFLQDEKMLVQGARVLFQPRQDASPGQ